MNLIKEKPLNVILLGAQKAGTSSLYNWIEQHPDVFAPEEMKDFHFFSVDRLYNEGLDYLSSFYKEVKEEKIIMKGAVNYIFFPHAAKRLYEYEPDLKFILILRNPVDRAISAYNYFHKLGVENLSFGEALERERNGEFKSIKELSDFAYLEHGFYYGQLQEYLRYFRLEQFKILIYEEVISNKEEAIKDVYSFLDINPSFLPKFEYINKTSAVRFRSINYLLFGNNNFRKLLKPLLDLIPIQYKIKLGHIMREVNSEEKPKKVIKKFFIPQSVKEDYWEDIDNLGKLLNKDLMKIWQFGDAIDI